MIKQVIDGKTYNTETARRLATVELMGYRTDQRGRFTTNTPSGGLRQSSRGEESGESATDVRLQS